MCCGVRWIYGTLAPSAQFSIKLKLFKNKALIKNNLFKTLNTEIYIYILKYWFLISFTLNSWFCHFCISSYNYLLWVTYNLIWHTLLLILMQYDHFEDHFTPDYQISLGTLFQPILNLPINLIFIFLSHPQRYSERLCWSREGTSQGNPPRRWHSNWVLKTN